jgi:hypothetical protein
VCERCALSRPRLRLAARLTHADARSFADAVALRATQATPILAQVRSDVTRYRYGDEQHLDEALLRIFRINKARAARAGRTNATRG